MTGSWAGQIALCAVLAVGLPNGALAAQPRSEPQSVVDSSAIEAALQKPAPAAAPTGEVIRTRGLRLQAREEESRDSGSAQGAGPRGSVDLQIAFALDSATLLPAARQQLGELAKALQSTRLSGQAFVLAGHTDATGKPEHNRELSLARANSVRDYLQRAGIDTANLSVAGYGADKPLADHSPYDAANRRVEVRTLGNAP